MSTSQAEALGKQLFESVYNNVACMMTIPAADGVVWTADIYETDPARAFLYATVDGQRQERELDIHQDLIMTAIEQCPDNIAACNLLNALYQNPLMAFNDRPTLPSDINDQFLASVYSGDMDLSGPITADPSKYSGESTFLYKKDPRYMVVSEGYRAVMFVQSAINGDPANQPHGYFSPLARVEDLDEAAKKIEELSRQGIYSRHNLDFWNPVRIEIGDGYVDYRTIIDMDRSWNPSEAYLEETVRDVAFELSYSSDNSQYASLVRLKNPEILQRAITDSEFAQNLIALKGRRILKRVHPHCMRADCTIDEVLHAVQVNGEFHVWLPESRSQYVSFHRAEAPAGHEGGDWAEVTSAIGRTTFMRDFGPVRLDGQLINAIMREADSLETLSEIIKGHAER